MAKILLFLSLGAIMNVAVAWGFTLCTRVFIWDRVNDVVTSTQPPCFYVQRYCKPGVRAIRAWPTKEWPTVDFGKTLRTVGNVRINPKTVWLGNSLWTWPHPRDIGLRGAVPARPRITIDARGWPLPCLYRYSIEDLSDKVGDTLELSDDHFGQDWQTTFTISLGESVPADLHDRSTLPLRPLWGAFAIDTVVFAIAAAVAQWLLTMIVVALRQMSPGARVFALASAPLVGAAITVALSWASAAWIMPIDAASNNVRLTKGGLDLGPEMHQRWLVELHEKSGAVRLVSTWSGRVTYSFGLWNQPGESAEAVLPYWAAWARPPAASMGPYTRVIDGRGWPMLAMWCSWNWSGTGAGGAKATTPVHGIALPSKSPANLTSVRALPLRPIPLGFAIDTIVYTLAWLVMLGFLGAARRGRGAWRRKRGRCPNCAYPIGASDVCTECGKPLSAKRVGVSA